MYIYIYIDVQIGMRVMRAYVNSTDLLVSVGTD